MCVCPKHGPAAGLAMGAAETVQTATLGRSWRRPNPITRLFGCSFPRGRKLEGRSMSEPKSSKKYSPPEFRLEWRPPI
jgi:hypothetical protein